MGQPGRERLKRIAAVKISGKASENWNRIFGSEEEIAERRRKAIEDQKRAEREQMEHLARENAMAVVPDTLPKREWYPSLGKYIGSRSEIKATFAAAKARGDYLEHGR